MDDFVIIHHDKNYLKFCLKEIEKELDKLKLKINKKKTKIDSIKNGIDFLGFNFYIKNNKIIMKIRNNTKKKFKKRIKNLKVLKLNNLINEKEFKMFLSSYKGHLHYGNCKSLLYKALKGQVC